MSAGAGAYRPVALARRHGLSAQAVRNYERDGVLPPAERGANGYRRFTDVHALALSAYLALIAAHGHAVAGEIMRAVNRGDAATALRLIDVSHALLQRDRDTLDAVESAVPSLARIPSVPRPGVGRAPAVGRASAPGGASAPGRAPAVGRSSVSIGVLAARLGVRPATLRTWERAGIVRPARDRATGYRIFTDADVRDAELAHLLRRGGYGLGQIAVVIDRVRDAGGPGPLAESLQQWRDRLTHRGLAMLTAAARLSDYLPSSPAGPPDQRGVSV